MLVENEANSRFVGGNKGNDLINSKVMCKMPVFYKRAKIMD